MALATCNTAVAGHQKVVRENDQSRLLNPTTSSGSLDHTSASNFFNSLRYVNGSSTFSYTVKSLIRLND